MAIERVLLDTTSQQANIESILDFLGSDLPEGVTITVNGGTLYVKATPARMSSEVVVSSNPGIYHYGFRTSKGVMVVHRDGNIFFVITKSNLGTNAIIGKQPTSTTTTVLDLTYSNSNAALTNAQVKRDITSFTPIVLAEGTHTPYCYICREAQNDSRVACTMMAGGKTFAYSGLVALED